MLFSNYIVDNEILNNDIEKGKKISILNMVRSMLKEKKMSYRFWVDVVSTSD